MWPLGGSFPPEDSLGPRVKAWVHPCPRVVPPDPPGGGHLLKPFDSPRLEVGKAACGRSPTPRSAGPTAGPHEPLRLLTTRQLTSVVREHVPGLPGGPSSGPPDSQGSGRVFLDRRQPRPVPLAVAAFLQAAASSVRVDGSASLSGICRGGSGTASRLLPFKWLLFDLWALLSPWRAAAIPQGSVP